MTSAPWTPAAAVWVAFAVDAWLGEPPARWHPVVWMGRALSVSGAPWPAASAAQACVRGCAAWLVGAALTVGVAWMLAGLAASVAAPVAWPVPPLAVLAARAVLLGVLLKPLLAWRLLRDEVAAVERALAAGLPAGRERLAHLVSRPTAALTATEVRESALESLAENLNDSFVAPLFWFVVGGLPGAALYRFANTADAMWGYRGRWEWAGKCSALVDDVLSYVPARLTAGLLSIAAWHWPAGLRREARRTASPNGGWPMGMMALALDVRLGKPGAYVLHPAGHEVGADAFRRGVTLASRAAWLAAAGAAAACAVAGAVGA